MEYGLSLCNGYSYGQEELVRTMGGAFAQWDAAQA